MTPGGVAQRSWWQRNRWLTLRRTAQFSILSLFLLGPWFGIWWFKGNLASSILFDTVSLTDPYIFLQSLASGHEVGRLAVIGAITVAIVYAVIGGRVYCSWVCPVNVITDAAQWLRDVLRIPAGWQPRKSTRMWILAMTLVVSALTGTIAWEFVNPITMIQRGMVFGLGLSWAIVIAVFLFDLLVSRRGWCSRICPVGAFYGLVGKGSMVRVSAYQRSACTDCGDCFRVCPEPHVITPALYGAADGAGPVIKHSDCTNCGRCIDVCNDSVFKFSTRFHAK